MTQTSLTQDDPVLKSCTFHRRIQDFVRGGGAKALFPPGGGGGAKALLACASLFGGAIFCGGGGQGLGPPPLDPRMLLPPSTVTLLALMTVFPGTATLANTEMVTNWAVWCQSIRHVKVLLLSCHEIKNNIC